MTETNSNEKWTILSHPGDYVEMGKKYGISPVTARIMRNRGLKDDEEIREYLEKDPSRLLSPESSGWNLTDMDRAVRITAEKIRGKKKIRVIGDYDIDGISATYILLKGIRKAGGEADHYIPHRIRDGYGLNENIIWEAKEDNTDTIITCDNGISASKETALARSLGMTVIVTDHHEIPFHMDGDERKEDLPDADAVVDPMRDGGRIAFRSICGAYVAYKFITCLYEEMGMDNKDAEEFLEIAAFATVGDVMPLVGENRILVKEGLERLKETDNPGLRSLIEVNKLTGKALTPYHIGFILGPCLNAAGRLYDAEDALNLLLSENEEEAREKASALKEMNDSRKDLTEKGTGKAMEAACSPEYINDTVLVIQLNDCHESIAGIIAGRVRERTGKPVFILTEGSTPEGGPCFKGSGRSIESFHMFEEMSKVSDLFIRFGGHAMAAGLSIDKDRLSEFRRRINENSVLSEKDLGVKRKIDMELPFSMVSFSLIEELRSLEPFGTGNEKPLFAARDVTLSDMKVLGSSRNVIKGRVSDGTGGTLDFVIFTQDAEETMADTEDLQRQGNRLKIVFSPEINEYRGERNIQLIIEGIK